ncbi:MAG: hypothetical protein FJ290_17245 [Planctomycetes bacterium]|nr:hypothetical protein [Planctomycetota bacterium]
MLARIRNRTSERYVVLTGDIVSSRQVANRAQLQARLRKLLARVNNAYRELIVVPMTISGGDEFQGVVTLHERVPAILKDLAQGLLPVQVRVGVGVGTLSTGLAARAQEMDGEAFVRSRQAVEEAKRDDARLWFVTGDGFFDLAANAISRLLWAIRESWKPLHWRRAALKDQGWTEARIARAEGVRQASISGSLAWAGHAAVRNGEASLADLWRQRLRV